MLGVDRAVDDGLRRRRPLNGQPEDQAGDGKSIEASRPRAGS